MKKYKYYKNENISGSNLLLVPFVMIKYKYYRHENICGANLLLVPFVMIKYRSVQNHLKVYIGV